MSGTDVELLLWAAVVAFLVPIYITICVLFVAVRYGLRDRRAMRRARQARIAAHEARIKERAAQGAARPVASGIHVGRRVA